MDIFVSASNISILIGDCLRPTTRHDRDITLSTGMIVIACVVLSMCSLNILNSVYWTS